MTQEGRSSLAAPEGTSDARDRGILEAALDAIIVIDTHGRITETNLAAERILGWQRSDLVGRMLNETLIPPRYRAAHQLAFAEHLRTGVQSILGQRLELHARRADGSEFPCELIVTRVDLADEVIFAGHIRDISDRREAERVIRESEARLRTLTEAMPEAVFLFDAAGRMVIANPAALALTATGSALDFADLVARLDVDAEEASSLRLGRRVGPLEARLAPRGRWVEWNSHPVEVPPQLTALGEDAAEGREATMVVL
nr:PAS domain S-box protein [Chloroflexota bacterium]